jgi:PST family polysaccharide transporter
MSTLFWINILLGLLLMAVAFAMAPAIAAFYRNPQLFWVTAVLASGFLFNAAGIRHSALLQRQMRFTTLAMISVVCSIVGIAIGIGGARAGYGYWALVVMTVASPLVATVGVWLSTAGSRGCPADGLEFVR